jgi:sugar/nucleoside kinase (ribokinase family)
MIRKPTTPVCEPAYIISIRIAATLILKLRSGMIDYVMIGGITLDDTVVHNSRATFDAPGGNSIYSALGAWLWTEAIGIVSCVGPDYPNQYLQTLENSGIDTRGIKQMEVPSQHLWLLYEEDGSRQFVFHKNSSQMDSEIDPTVQQIPTDYLHAKNAHLSAMGFNAQHAIASFLADQGIAFSYDIAQASLMTEGQQYSGNFATSKSKLLLPSMEEVELIYGKQPLLPLLKKISDTGPKIIAVKMGSKGSIVFNAVESRAYRIPVYPVEVVDSTGAGDAYCGGFVVGYHETGSILEAGIYGTASASFAIEDFGAFHLLEVDRKEIIKRANELRKNVEPL